ncbi:MAG: leucine-rich repeat protein [Candidatus Gracilibacteria bacterium]|nr:leucine-rich repeat protein [Candidatus Gracilibacteria bacterium]
MKKNNKAFTLVELIVVITILAILGTIAFINLQGYSTSARDGKRVSDINNIMKKIGIESSKGTSLSSLITTTKTNSGLTINGQVGGSIQGVANFATLKEDGSKFKDPVTKGDYVLSYSVGGSGTGAYKFNQVSTVNEETNTAVVKGNYYKMQPSDSPSITYNPDSTYFVVDGGVDLPYTVQEGALVNNGGGTTCLEVADEGYFTFDVLSQTITGYDSTNGPLDIEIPCKIGGVDVISIGDYAFYYEPWADPLVGNPITSIIIPGSITSIGNYAFAYNNLASLTISDSITSIGNHAFDGNNLTSVIIPNSVTSIGDYAFYSNQLTSATIPNSITSIPYGIFGGNQLTSITIPAGVTSIEPWAFTYNNLTSVTIPDGVTIIGERSFDGNQLTSLVIPNNVTSIGDGSFNGNNLTSIIIPNSVITIGSTAFSNNDLTSVTLGNSVETILDSAFSFNNLTSITIPSSIVTLGYAFGSNGPTMSSWDVTGWAGGGTWNLSGNSWIKQ